MNQPIVPEELTAKFEARTDEPALVYTMEFTNDTWKIPVYVDNEIIQIIHEQAEGPMVGLHNAPKAWRDNNDVKFAFVVNHAFIDEMYKGFNASGIFTQFISHLLLKHNLSDSGARTWTFEEQLAADKFTIKLDKELKQPLMNFLQVVQQAKGISKQRKMDIQMRLNALKIL